MASEEIVLLGCGDVGPVFGPFTPLSELVRPTLATGDIRFAQCERLYSNRGTRQVHGGSHSRQTPDEAAVFDECGFNVVSVASNHAMDWGPEALLDTIEVLHKYGIQTIGAGSNEDEARRPAIIEKNGIRVAMLGYCSVMAKGCEARSDRAGVAPLRAYTYYRTLEDQPGMPPEVVTVTYDEDLEAMAKDIENAKKNVDIVIVSLHWGLHLIPRMIADYQPLTAEAAFKAGADLILGHHTHNPKAIGVHGGKVCFYSLSNFLISSPAARLTPEKQMAYCRRYGVTVDPDFMKLAHGTVDGRRSLIAKALLTRQGIKKICFLPVLIDRQLRPEILHHGDARFDDAVKYMDWASEEFNHKFVVEGDEVRIAYEEAEKC